MDENMTHTEPFMKRNHLCHTRKRTHRTHPHSGFASTTRDSNLIQITLCALRHTNIQYSIRLFPSLTTTIIHALQPTTISIVDYVSSAPLTHNTRVHAVQPSILHSHILQRSLIEILWFKREISTWPFSLWWPHFD